jgi:hypothetical protein
VGSLGVSLVICVRTGMVSIRTMVVLRARFRLRVSNLVSDKRAQEALQQPLERALTVDLFDPPLRETFRQRVCELRAGGVTQNDAAEQNRIEDARRLLNRRRFQICQPSTSNHAGIFYGRYLFTGEST